MTCKVFLVGEGPSDIGDLTRPSQFRAGKEGFLQPVLRRMTKGTLDVEFPDGRRLSTLPKTKIKTSSALFARHAAQAFVLAETFGCDAVVLAMDMDKTGGLRATPREAHNRFAALQESARRGFDDASRDAQRELPALVATPCRMIEAWAVAEHEDDPESLWGRENDASGSHPKAVFRRVHGADADFARVAEEIDLEVLEKRCPLSFAPFAEDVRKRVIACTSRVRSESWEGATTRKPRCRGGRE